MLDLRTMDPVVRNACLQSSIGRMQTMRQYRLTWWAHWGMLAELYLPRRYRWLVTPNNYERGGALNGNIIDETGMLAARTLATGMLAGLTSPTKPWFRMGLHGVKYGSIPEGDVKNWLAEVTRRILDVYAGSNIYSALGTSNLDNCVFGSSPLLQLEDPEDVIRFYNYALGEFFYGLDNRLVVDTLAREYTYTVSETVKEFTKGGDLSTLPVSIRTLAETPSNLDMEITIGHMIEPNGDIYYGGRRFPSPVPSRFKYREVYFAWASAAGGIGGSDSDILRIGGYLEKPFVGLRWDVTSNDAYGRSPGMDGLPANRQLQVQQRRKGEAIDKQVRPPMVASVSMKNEPADILPGGITYTSDPQAGFKPAFQVTPQIAEMKDDILAVQQREKDVFFNDLFRMISDLQTVRTATEIDARQQEKLILLGPVIERLENEGLDDIIERTFAIMLRRGMFPPPPPSIAGRTLQIEYISILAEAQRAASTGAIERWLQLGGGIAAVVPDAMDNYDVDKIIERYGDKLGVDPDLQRATAEVIAIRAKREQAMQAQAALQTGSAMAQGAQTLSQTDVGGGKNALQMVTGGLNA